MKKVRKKYGVLLEYVILLCSILPVVFAVSYSVYSFGLFSDGFGTLGKSVVYHYQRIVTIISLPVP